MAKLNLVSKLRARERDRERERPIAKGEREREVDCKGGERESVSEFLIHLNHFPSKLKETTPFFSIFFFIDPKSPLFIS